MEFSFSRIGSITNHIPSLQKDWLALQLHAQNLTYFISWDWIEAWLQNIQSIIELEDSQNLWQLTVKQPDTDQVIGLGLFVERTVSGRLVKRKQFWLHKTGDEQLDQPWIEYNDLLLHASITPVQKQQMFDFVLKQLKQESMPTELHIDMTQPHSQSTSFEYAHYQKLSTAGYLKNLKPENNGYDLKQDFSKNTRQQINRSIKALTINHETKLLSLTDNVAKQQALLEISNLHKRQWRETSYGSGFDNAQFVQFHRDLISKQNTTVLKLKCGSHDIAFGYYFCLDETVYFYLSAIDKHPENKVKVGLVFHYLAMQHFQQLGYKQYDFLCGEARYKSSLSDSSYKQVSYCFISPHGLLQCEHFLRKIKRKLANDDKEVL